jgi:hypothetical protein
VPLEAAQALGELAQPIRGDPLGRRVDGRHPLGAHVVGRHARGHLVRGDPELVAIGALAVQDDAGPGRQLVGEPRLVEPDRLQDAGLVRDRGLHDRPPAARTAFRHAADVADDRGLLARDERHDRLGVAPVLVPERQVLEEIARRVDPEHLERGGGLLVRHRERL